MKKAVITGMPVLLLVAWAVLVLTRHHEVPPETGKRRYVSLSPSITETLFELGVGDEVVGVTTFCNYPPEARSRVKVGDFINPSLEKIYELKPDLVFAERWSSSRIVHRLEGLGFGVVETSSPQTIEEIYEVIGRIGDAVGKPRQAVSLIDSMKQRIEKVRSTGAAVKYRPAIYVEIDLPTWTVGRSSFIHEVIELCGGRNIFGYLDRPALQASKESILERKPDIIISFEATAGEIRRRPGWDQLPAVHKGAIIDGLNRDRLSRGNHRLVEGMEDLQRRIFEVSLNNP